MSHNMHCAKSVYHFLHSVAQLHRVLDALFGLYCVMHGWLYCVAHAQHCLAPPFGLFLWIQIVTVFYNTVQVRKGIVSNT